MEATVTKLEIGCDWLTATWKRDSSMSGQHIEDALAFEQSMFENGHMQEIAHWQGYYGRKTGSFFVGERKDDYCVKVSGSPSASAFTRLYRSDMHVSRLDLSVTAWLSPHQPDIGRDANSAARLAKLAGKVKHPAKITHVEGDDGGYTLYIGKRSSRIFARLYNKEVESDDAYYEGAWRYECELHNATATETAQELVYSVFPLEEAICSAVWAFWYSKGVKPVFATFPTGMEIVLPRREETTIERSLRWLETQVRPTVAKLIALGYTSSVLDALGLPGADFGHTDKEVSNGR